MKLERIKDIVPISEIVACVIYRFRLLDYGLRRNCVGNGSREFQIFLARCTGARLTNGAIDRFGKRKREAGSETNPGLQAGAGDDLCGESGGHAKHSGRL